MGGFWREFREGVGIALVTVGTAVVIASGFPGIVGAIALTEGISAAGGVAAATGFGLIASSDPTPNKPDFEGLPPGFTRGDGYDGTHNPGDSDEESVGSNSLAPPPAWVEHGPEWPPEEDRVDPWPWVPTKTANNLGIKNKGAGSETTTKNKKQNPLSSRYGDFSGLVDTFVNPVTSRIIGYKGIPRKRKFRALTHWSPFWDKQIRLTQPSVLDAPFSP